MASKHKVANKKVKTLKSIMVELYCMGVLAMNFIVFGIWSYLAFSGQNRIVWFCWIVQVATIYLLFALNQILEQYGEYLK